MPDPLRPASARSPRDIPPCSSCGNKVRIVMVPGPRLFGADEPEMVEERQCTSPTCEFNDGTPRGFGDGP